MDSCLKPCVAKISETVNVLTACFRVGGKLLICGNGGSCADADHIVGEMMKNFEMKRPLSAAVKTALLRYDSGDLLAEKLSDGLPAINLGAHSALVTALMNDVGADYIFAQQAVAYGKPGDVLLGISTSGNSKDVIYAGMVAKAMGMTTVGFTGADGGEMAGLFDICICVPSTATAEIQQMHAAVYHQVCREVEQAVFA